MKSATTAEKTDKPTPRRAGRRPREDGGPELSRASVIECAIQLAQKESLDNISMVRLARELGVTPALIHYYMGSRDDLLSAVINSAYKERMRDLPPLTGQWRTDLEVIVRATSRTHTKWPGLAAYIATHNRFRLFQKVSAGEVDYGLAFFDHVGVILKSGGFKGPQAALVFHLLMLFVVSIGSTSANRQAPKDHGDFIVGYLQSYEPESIPGATFLMKPFAKIDNETSFETGLKLLLDGFESWREPVATTARKTKA
jgi:AcrR family transcriptional regulator